jgi:hypothetical protein
MDIREEYKRIVEEFKEITKKRATAMLGESHNELTRKRHALRKRILELRAEHPDWINVPESMADETIVEKEKEKSSNGETSAETN